MGGLFNEIILPSFPEPVMELDALSKHHDEAIRDILLESLIEHR